MNKIIPILFISVVACNSSSDKTVLEEKKDSASVTSIPDTSLKPEIIRVQDLEVVKNLNTISAVAKTEQRSLGLDSMQAKKQWDHLNKISDSVTLKIFDLQDKCVTGYFVTSEDKIIQPPKDYLIKSFAKTNREWVDEHAFNIQEASAIKLQRNEFTTAVSDLYADIDKIEQNAYLLFKVQKVEVEVKVLDALDVEQTGFSVYCDSKYSKERDNFNPTKNAKRQIYPGTKIFYIKKGNIEQMREVLVSAIDPNSRLVIFKL